MLNCLCVVNVLDGLYQSMLLSDVCAVMSLSSQVLGFQQQALLSRNIKCAYGGTDSFSQVH